MLTVCYIDICIDWRYDLLIRRSIDTFLAISFSAHIGKPQKKYFFNDSAIKKKKNFFPAAKVPAAIKPEGGEGGSV